ncbi:unnamed protein product [Symbiodinium necroappetens]|uniref:Uncharacterized protein n=1 Tax=Symbiodinium necroappetens TaxID=1628268 RepID=A0A812RA12_9DINO|nr:unnamed protein product [Symbiodinium necroappetens]
MVSESILPVAPRRDILAHTRSCIQRQVGGAGRRVLCLASSLGVAAGYPGAAATCGGWPGLVRHQGRPLDHEPGHSRLPARCPPGLLLGRWRGTLASLRGPLEGPCRRVSKQ